MLKLFVGILIVFLSPSLCAQQLARFYEENKMGLRNETTNQVVVSPQYDRISLLSKGFLGIMYGNDTEPDEAGQYWISPEGKEYRHLRVKGTDFSEGLLLCENQERNNETTYINDKGESVITGYYDKATDFSEGMALVSEGGNTFGGYNESIAKVYFIDKQGKKTTLSFEKKLGAKLLFDTKTKFTKGRALVKVQKSDDEYYLVDKKGNTQSIKELIKKLNSKLPEDRKGKYVILPADFMLSGNLLIGWGYDKNRQPIYFLFDEKNNPLFLDEPILSVSNLLNGKRLLFSAKPNKNGELISRRLFFINTKNKVVREASDLLGKNIKIDNLSLYQFPDNKILVDKYLLDENLNIIPDQTYGSDGQKIVIHLSKTKEMYVMPLLEGIAEMDRKPSENRLDAFKMPANTEKILLCHEYAKDEDKTIDKDTDCNYMRGCFDCMILFQQNGKIGAVNTVGKVIIPAEYEAFKDNFINNYATTAKKNGKWGKIDRNNKVLSPFEVDEYAQGKSVTFSKKNGKWGAERLLPHEYEAVPEPLEEFFHDNFIGVYVVQKNGKKGLIRVKKESMDGEALSQITQILPFEYDAITYSYKEGTATQNGQKYYFNDNTPPVSFPYQSFRKTYFRGKYESHLIVKDENGKEGIWEIESGKLIIPCNYDYLDIRSYRDEFIFITQNGEYGIISLENKVLVPAEYDYISRNFGEKGTYFLVEKNRKQGVMQASKFVIPLTYDEVGRFYTHPAMLIGVKKGNKWGFISTKFKQVLPFEYEEDEDGYLQSFEMHSIIAPKQDLSVAILRKNGKYGLADSKGKILLPFEYEALRALYYNHGENADHSKPLYEAFTKKNSPPILFYWKGGKLIEK